MPDTPQDISAGELLRASLQADLDANHVTLDAAERALLDRACAVADRIQALEGVIAEHGLTTTGRRGLIVSPAVTEVRHQGALLKSLLAGIRLRAESADSKSKKGRAAAQSRWARATGPTPLSKLPGADRTAAHRPERVIPEAM